MSRLFFRQLLVLTISIVVGCCSLPATGEGEQQSQTAKREAVSGGDVAPARSVSLQEQFASITGVSIETVLKNAIVDADKRGDRDSVLVLVAAIVVISVFQQAIGPVLWLVGLFLLLRYVPAYLNYRKTQQLQIVEAILPYIESDDKKATIIVEVLGSNSLKKTVSGLNLGLGAGNQKVQTSGSQTTSPQISQKPTPQLTGATTGAQIPNPAEQAAKQAAGPEERAPDQEKAETDEGTASTSGGK